MEAFRSARPDIDHILDLDAFEADLRGSIVLPGSPDYDEARLVHHALSDAARHSSSVPPMPRTSRDRLVARESGLELSIRAAATAWPATARTTVASSSTWAR